MLMYCTDRKELKSRKWRATYKYLSYDHKIHFNFFIMGI